MINGRITFSISTDISPAFAGRPFPNPPLPISRLHSYPCRSCRPSPPSWLFLLSRLFFFPCMRRWANPSPNVSFSPFRDLSTLLATPSTVPPFSSASVFDCAPVDSLRVFHSVIFGELLFYLPHSFWRSSSVSTLFHMLFFSYLTEMWYGLAFTSYPCCYNAETRYFLLFGPLKFCPCFC